MEISIHVHEDDWRMRNLHPLDALPEVSTDVQDASEAGVRNRAPDGVGWTNVYLIKQPSTDYSAVGLRLADAVSILEPLMPRVRKFTATATAGFDPRVRDAGGTYDQDAYCYGFGPSCFIKLETDGNLIKDIWFECTTRDIGKVAALRGALLAIDVLVPSAIADYWNDMAGAIRDSEFLDRYFRELTQRNQ